jgi:hypothetical protein
MAATTETSTASGTGVASSTAIAQVQHSSNFFKELGAHLLAAAHELDQFAIKALPFLGGAAVAAETLTGNGEFAPLTEGATQIAEKLAAGLETSTAAADVINTAATAAVGAEDLSGNSSLNAETTRVATVVETLAAAAEQPTQTA